MEGLKPCPFCGDKHAHIFIKLEPFSKYPITYWRKSLAIYKISCSNLECRAEVSGFLTQEDAIAAWNRRAEQWH